MGSHCWPSVTLFPFTINYLKIEKVKAGILAQVESNQIRAELNWFPETESCDTIAEAISEDIKTRVTKSEIYYNRAKTKECDSSSDSDSESSDEIGDDPMQYIRQMEIQQAMIRIAGGEKRVKHCILSKEPIECEI